MVDKILKFNHNGWCEAIGKSYQQGYYRPIDESELTALQGYASEIIDLADQEIKVIRKPQYPLTVGTEAEKFEELYEGESYYASDTYRLYVGGKEGKYPFSVKGFPYHLVTPSYDGGSSVFRFYLHPDGNNNNTGLGWENAFRDMDGLFALLDGIDLTGWDVYVFIAPGAYPIDAQRIYNPRGGNFIFSWVGSFINSDDSDWRSWACNGVNDLLESNDPAIFEHTDPDGGTSDTHVISFRGSGNVVFQSADYSFGFGDVGFAYWDKLRFVGHASGVQKIMMSFFGDVSVFTETGLSFEPKNTSHMVVDHESTKQCTIKAIKITNATGSLKSSSSKWYGALVSANSGGIQLSLGGAGYAVGHAPTESTVHIEGIRHLVSSFGESLMQDIDLSGSFYWTAGSSGVAKPEIYLDTFTGGKYKYLASTVTLADNSIVARIINKDAVQTTYLTKSITQVGDNVNFNLPTTDPAVAGVLWSDAGTVKVSAG